MSTALLTAPVCLCLQIDRYCTAPDGQLVVGDCCLDLETEVSMPVFASTGLRCDMVGYIPIAAVLHVGHDLAGHCQAVLKMQPTISSGSPANWLLTNDDCRPTPIWQVPEWMLRRLCVLWLIRTDCLQLPSYHATQQMDTEPDMPDTLPLQQPSIQTDLDLLHLLQGRPNMADEQMDAHSS